jgi:hypothetical protein
MAARLRLLYHINLVNIQPVRIVAFLDLALASCVIVCRKCLVTGVLVYISVHHGPATAHGLSYAIDIASASLG